MPTSTPIPTAHGETYHCGQAEHDKEVEENGFHRETLPASRRDVVIVIVVRIIPQQRAGMMERAI